MFDVVFDLLVSFETRKVHREALQWEGKVITAAPPSFDGPSSQKRLPLVLGDALNIVCTNEKKPL